MTVLVQHYKLKEEQTNTPEFVRLINEAWQSLAPSDKQRYENRARADMARYLEEERLFDERQMEYSLLHKAAVDAGEQHVWAGTLPLRDPQGNS